MVTVPVTIELRTIEFRGRPGQEPHLVGDRLPELTCTSDLKRAAWIRADTPEQARADIAGLGGTVFPAHERMLTNAILGTLS